MMKKNVLALFVAVLVLNFAAALTMAQPSEPHRADAMWVEPSSVTFTSSNGTVGQKFNVTLWLNISATQTAFSYQVALKYNRTQLQCARAGFTAGTKSQFMSAHATSGLITIDTSFLGNGSILIAEASLDTAEPGPKADSLSWAEFQILAVPTAGNLTSKFNISGQYKPGGAGDTWVDKTGSFDYLDPLSCYDSVYLFVGPSGPPPPGPLSVSISPTSTSVGLNQTVLFSSNVTGGTPPYVYQWFLNDGAVSGANMSSWTFSSPTNGTYTVYLNVTDKNGSVAKSNVAVVTVVVSLLASISPTSASVLVNQTLLFGSTVSGGTPPYGYQWFVDDVTVSGATSASYSFSSLTNGTFIVHLSVTDSLGASAASNNASVSVVLPLSVSINVTSAMVAVNQTLSFGSTVSGGTPPYVGYQWFLNGSAVSGATSASYSFSSLTNGTFIVHLSVTDSLGRTAESNSASVIVGLKLPGDINGDGKVDAKDLMLAAFAFGSMPDRPNWNPDADLNHDGKVDGKDLVIVAKSFGSFGTGFGA